MAMLKRPNKELPLMGRSKPDGRCKKHSKHEQSPGVCSLCLNEKLSQLLNAASSSRGSYTKRGYYSSSSLSSDYSSSSGSSCSSPIHRYRYAPDGKGSFFSSLFGGNTLTKSRSLAFVSRMRNNKESGDDVKNKGGFFSRLLRPRQKRRDEGNLVHSRTMRETVIVITN